ncbi:RNA-binding protein 42 [Irineochytrium annulatum]|nr:RNA-binding protein 42 [Irineochytrium annulatum]
MSWSFDPDAYNTLNQGSSSSQQHASYSHAPVYNPLDISMSNGFVSAAGPVLNIPHPDRAHHHQLQPQQQHYQSQQQSYASMGGSGLNAMGIGVRAPQSHVPQPSATQNGGLNNFYHDMKEAPYPEGYVPKPKAEGGSKKSKNHATSGSNSTTVPFSVVGSRGGTVTGPHYSMPSNKMEERKKKKKIIRAAGGEVWEDPTLLDWDPNDFRLFCGDLGNEVTDEILQRAFSKYPSLMKARVIRDKKTAKSKGYGFVSFKDPNDFVGAMKEMNGKYVGNRPIKLRKSTWDERNANPKNLHKVVGGAVLKK